MKKIVFLTLSLLVSLLFAKDSSDEKLRILARQNGLKSTPENYDKLLMIVDNPKNHMNAKKINLGRTLFFEPLLSRDESLTCASCHKMNEGGDDNLPTAIGFKNRKNPKHLNSPTVLDTATSRFLFWDGRAKSLEEQAGGPIKAHFEMNLTPEELVSRLLKISIYRDNFKEVFIERINFKNIKKAIAAYERTLLTRGKYDDFLDGDDSAISMKAKEGLRLFIKQGCVKCHYGVALGGQDITRFPMYGKTLPFKNTGGFKGKDDKYLYRVPILRNITQTAPYYHNGTIQNLKDVIKIEGRYETGKEISNNQIKLILEFLKTLDGKLVDYGIEG